ncbi:MAG: Mur ligase family protein [Candidatus Microgenomates bacterium]
MFFEIIIGKIVSRISEFLNIGSGSTWPGHIILNLDKKFISKILNKNPHLKIIIIAGTNGKTTTTALTCYILEKLGFKVFSNKEGANLINGIASVLLKKSTFFGKLNYDFAVFEVDEFSLPLILNKISANYIFLLNLFRDQLDRYGEVNTIGTRWFNQLKNINKDTILIVNGDDPYLFFNSQKLINKKIYFGIPGTLMKLKNLTHDIDFIYCPNCQTILKYKKISYSHLGDYYCQKCGFKRGSQINDFKNHKIKYPVEGLYNIYNTNAVLSFIKEVFKIEDFNKLLKNFKTPFGRQEEIEYKNRTFFLLLSKNPAGFNQSIKAVNKILKNKKANLLIILNNRIPDGLDVSWIWDVDFDNILKNAKNIYISGDRIYDMALRFKYENIKTKIFSNYKKAIEEMIKISKKGEKIFVLPTYSAMLELRKFLIGKKFN